MHFVYRDRISMLHHILLLNQICVFHLLCNVLSWSSGDNKPFKMPSDSILEGLIFQNFLGACPQSPLDLACFA